MKKNKYLLITIVLLSIMFIGYSIMSKNIKINGHAGIQKNTWSIHWDNNSINVTTGSVSSPTPIVTDFDQQVVEFSTILHQPKDYYEFTIDVVNDGSIDGMIEKIEYKIYKNDEEVPLPKFLDYKVTYEDGKEIRENYLLKKNSRETFKIKVLYRDDIEKEDLPDDDTFKIDIKVISKQPDDTSVDKEIPTTLLSGKEVNRIMKSLITSSATYETVNNNVVSILRTTTPPSNVTTKIISETNSTYPVYVWYQNNTIYYYSKTDNIYLNEDSSYLFYNFTKLKNLDTDVFNTINTLKINNMFYKCSDLENIKLTFNTENITNMESMFFGCTNIKNIDLSSFNTSNVKKMNSMFRDCSVLESLDLSNFDTSKVKAFQNMFRNCKNLVNLNISSFRTPEATDMSLMFYDMEKIKKLDLTKWDTKKVTTMESMFYMCYELEYLNLSNFVTPLLKKCKDFFDTLYKRC